MKKIAFIVEKTSTGYSAYAKDFEACPVGTTADTLAELKVNVVDALNSFNIVQGLKEATINEVVIQLDIAQFFDYYSIINANALGERIGMNKTLISQYINGKKQPSNKQVMKIMEGIKSLGKELTELELIEA